MDLPPIVFDRNLSAFDYMLYRADMDAHSRTSMMFIETLDVSPDVDRLRAMIERATRGFPRLRQRVVAPMLPVTRARWVVDPDFDLDYHFRRIALPGPGTFRQLLDLAATLHASPLDHGRPLWEVTLVDGLQTEDAQAAILWKMSHTITDGVGGLVLDRLIHDEQRESPDLPMLPLPSAEDLTSVELTKSGLRRLPKAVIGGSVTRGSRVVGTAARAVRHPLSTATTTARTVNEVRRMAGPPVAEPSPLLQRRSLNRRFEALDFELSALRATAKAHGGSVNDAYLAGIAGALRRYHDELGVPVDALPLAMPINVRAAGSDEAGNQWSAVTLPLPVAEIDVAKRLQQIREQVLTARSESTINPARLVAPVLAWVPQQIIAGSGSGSLGIDVQASNVPGHPSDRYCAGARITRSVPIGPLPGVAMMVTMVTLAGRCFVGVHYDTAAIRDHELFLRCLTQGFAEVTRPVTTRTTGRDTRAEEQKVTPLRQPRTTTKEARP